VVIVEQIVDPSILQANIPESERLHPAAEEVALLLRDPEDGRRQWCITRREPWLRVGVRVYFSGGMAAFQTMFAEGGRAHLVTDVMFAGRVHLEDDEIS
jgi:hypothetical protein